MAFKRKWAPKVERAIREAVAEGMRTKAILSGLHAGTLPALNDEPVAVPERTFYELLRRARAKVAAGVKSKTEEPSVLARWAERQREVRRLADDGHTAREIIEAVREHVGLLAVWLRPRIPSEVPYLNTPEGKGAYAEWLRRHGVVYWSLERLHDAHTEAYHGGGLDPAAADEAVRALAIETDNAEGRGAAAVACLLDARRFGIELDPADVGLSEFPPISFAGPPMTGSQWDRIVEAIRPEPVATNGAGP